MPLQLVRLFRRKKHRSASAATSNAAQRGTSDSDDNDAQLGAFAPSLNGANIGTIHGSLFSNNQLNQIHHHHHHHPQADDDTDYAEIKVRDIILETELGSGSFHHALQSDGTLVKVGWIRKYTGRLFQQPHGSMLIHKYEGLAIRSWKRDFHRLAGVRHPNIIQLYGLCHTRNFTALIFHNVQQTNFREYHLSLPGPSFVTYIADLMDQLQCHKLTRIKSAGDALQGHGLEPEYEYLPSYNVDYAGQLVVDAFEPAREWFIPPLAFSKLPFTPALKALASTFKDKSLTRSSLVKYYDLLAMVCSVHDIPFSTIKNVSITHKGITTKLCPRLPYIARLCLGSKEIVIELEYVSDMLRCTIPVSQLLDGPVWHHVPIEVQTQRSTGRSSSPLFHVWASQIQHIIKTMKMDAPSEVLTVMPHAIHLFCRTIKRSTPLPYDSFYLWHDPNHPDRRNHWWSTDLEGQIPISTTVVEGASDVAFLINVWSYHIPQQIYSILWDLHKACGFSPDSTEMVEYLGYPLLEPRTDSMSVSGIFGPAQEAGQPSHSGYESEVGSDSGSSSSHETFVSALLED